MTSSNKIPVGILGATGSVGQKFVEILHQHPWFEITAIAASIRSTGKTYEEACNWISPKPMPKEIAKMKVSSCQDDLPCSVVFSGLDSKVATEIELDFANAGHTVISNSKNYRWHKNVPLLIPEVNMEQLSLLNEQTEWKGKIITNPNCVVMALAVALAPLEKKFGISSLNVVTLQALSGAGYPGVPSLDILGNVIPFIDGEEEKVETEPLKIFGRVENGVVENKNWKISAQCNRVPVEHGHMINVSVKLKNDPGLEGIIKAFREFESPIKDLQLPTSPERPLVYLDGPSHPRPKLHRDLGNGMTVSVGRAQKCSIQDYKFVVLGHNTMRGAAGCALLNGELLKAKGLLS